MIFLLKNKPLKEPAFPVAVDAIVVVDVVVVSRGVVVLSLNGN